eukprot:augustus_masked-scaffold_42-processed-gene-0.46-mRNA-1 protein AED:0.20 eAED:0.20 QI:0/0/0/1/1/1/2/0/329
MNTGRNELFGNRSQQNSNSFSDETARLYEKENDEHIDGLSSKISSLKHIALDIGQEVNQHNSYLDNMENQFGSVGEMMTGALEKIDEMMKAGGSKYLCYLISDKYTMASPINEVTNLSDCSTSRSITTLLSKLRSTSTSHQLFARSADRLCTILAEEALAFFSEPETFTTPCGTVTALCNSSEKCSAVCAISILRSGEILSETVRKLCPEILSGKILIQRDESDPEKRPKLFYSKLPDKKKVKGVILCDPMLATGGSSVCALEVLKEAGYPLDKCVFANVISCPEGLEKIQEKFPEVKIITCVVDEKLNGDKFIVPGLGDFGDRYYGTD